MDSQSADCTATSALLHAESREKSGKENNVDHLIASDSWRILADDFANQLTVRLIARAKSKLVRLLYERKIAEKVPKTSSTKTSFKQIGSHKEDEVSQAPTNSKKLDVKNPQFQSFSRKLLGRIEEIVTRELTSLSNRRKSEILPPYQIKNEKAVNSKKKQATKVQIGADNIKTKISMETYFVNRLVNTIEENVKYQIYELAQDKVLSNIFSELQNLEKELIHLNDDVMALHSCTPCDREESILNGIKVAKTMLGKVNIILDDIVLALLEIQCNKKKNF